MNEQQTHSAEAAWWGGQIRHMRIKRCLTQADLAASVVAASDGTLTLDRSAVAHWERGQNPPALRYRRLIAVALDADVDLLFGPVPAGYAA